MLKTIEVEIDSSGHIHPVEPLNQVSTGQELSAPLDTAANETLHVAESALAEDWLRPQEDAAWAHLQQVG